MDWKEHRDWKMSSVLKLEIPLEEKGFSVLSLQNSPQHSRALEPSGRMGAEATW